MTERIIPERFLDAGEEPYQTLTPISGYENYPLVSLKEAIEPIKSLLYNCDTMIEIAKRNCHNPTDGLTQDESASIHLYTMQWPKPYSSLYTILNERLRSQDRNTLIEWFLYFKLFFTALYKLPSIKGTIWRGIRGKLRHEYDKDAFWWGISSCTERMNVMEKFVGSNGDRTIFSIDCLNGKSIQLHSYFKDENEIILLPGTYFQVRSKWKAARGLYMIQLKEQIPPYETLTSPADHGLTLKTKVHSIENTLLGNSFLSIEKIFESRCLDTKFSRWKENGLTVAGGNGRGDQLNQFYRPQKLIIEENKTMYIVDWGNHRIIQWKFTTKKGKIIAGGNGQGNRIDQLSHPSDAIIDQQNHSMIITDWGNNRVIRWSLNKNPEVLLQNIHCCGVTIDKYGYIYVSDWEKNEVKRWKQGEEGKAGILVAGGNGCGIELDQLNRPTYLAVDNEQSVYVSDNRNHRVMKWRKGAKEGVIVAGGNGRGENLNQLSYPTGLMIDSWGQIYVADCGNHRIMRWREEKLEGEIVLGGNGKGEKINEFNEPIGLSFDTRGNLYVVDSCNHRIQKFDIDLEQKCYLQ